MIREAEAQFGRAGDVKAKVEITNSLPERKLKREIEIQLQNVERVQKEVQSVKESVQRKTYSSVYCSKTTLLKSRGD